MRAPDRNARVALACAAVVVGMVGAGFAAVPLYDVFCRVTGFGGTTRVATEAPDRILEREMTIRFDGSVADAPLRFEPEATTMTVRVGERALAYYTVTNLSDRPVTSVASYNITPFKAAPYFNKLQCFCFTEQVFQPGETQELAVLFFVDPELDDEARLDEVKEITLSYTFFEKAGTGEALAARQGEDGAGG